MAYIPCSGPDCPVCEFQRASFEAALAAADADALAWEQSNNMADEEDDSEPLNDCPGCGLMTGHTAGCEFSGAP